MALCLTLDRSEVQTLHLQNNKLENIHENKGLSNISELAVLSILQVKLNGYKNFLHLFFQIKRVKDADEVPMVCKYLQ